MRLLCLMWVVLGGVLPVAATDVVPAEGPVHELIGRIEPAEREGFYRVQIEQVVTDPAGLFKDNPQLREQPLTVAWAVPERTGPEGLALLSVQSPDKTSGQWRVTAARPAVGSRPVTRDGLQIVVTAAPATVAANQPVTIVIELVNKTDKPLALLNAAEAASWVVNVSERQARSTVDAEPRDPQVTVLEAGQATHVTRVIDPATHRYVRVAPSGDMPPLDELGPGSYVIRASRSFTKPSDELKDKTGAAFWTGQIASEGIAVTLTKPVGRVTGKIVDQDGRPVAGARVSLVSESAPGKKVKRRHVDPATGTVTVTHTRANIVEVKTGADGVFTAELPPAEDVVINANAQEGGAGVRHVRVARGKTTSIGTLTLERGLQ